MTSARVDLASLAIVKWLREYVQMLKILRKQRYGEFTDIDSKIDVRIAEVEGFLQRLEQTQVIN